MSRAFLPAALLALTLGVTAFVLAQRRGGGARPKPEPPVSARSGAPRFDPTPAAAIAARRKVGLNVNGTGGVILDEDVAMVQALQVTQIRHTLYWTNHLGDAAYRAAWAAGMQRARAAGLDVLVVVHTPPAGMTIAEAIAAMPGFVAARAAEYPGTSWQLLNEMDGVPEWNGGWFTAGHTPPSDAAQQANGVTYAPLLAAVYDAVKAADPTALVVTGGTAHQPVPFYQGIVAGGAAAKMDAFALHAYGVPNTGQFTEKSIAMRAVLGATPGVQLWITEFGTQHADDGTQAAGVGAVLEANDRHLRYDRAYLYALFTAPEAEPYGVVRRNEAGVYVRRHAAMLLVERPNP